jgi:hypothetical protein
MMKMGKAFDATSWSRHNTLWTAFQLAIAKEGEAAKAYSQKPSEATAKASRVAYNARVAAEKTYDEFMKPYRSRD